MICFDLVFWIVRIVVSSLARFGSCFNKVM